MQALQRVDNQPAVRGGLTLVLALEDIVVSAKVTRRTEALAHLEKQRPDVATVNFMTTNHLMTDVEERNG